MKKNLLSVLLLVLMIVNIALSAVMMISVTGTNKKTAALMESIGTAMNLELYAPGKDPEVSLADTDTHVMETMTIPLAYGSGGKQIYIVFDISLLLDKTHEDYASYSEQLSDYDSLVKDAVSQIVSNYTEEECRVSFTGDIRNEMLTAVQNLFQSKVVYGIALSNIKYSS